MTRIRKAVLGAAILFSISSACAKDDKWVEARSTNFIVVSNASPQQARNTAIQFEQIRELFRDSFVYAKDRPTPVITILAAKDENTLRTLLPEYWEKKGHTILPESSSIPSTNSRSRSSLQEWTTIHTKLSTMSIIIR